MNKKWVIKNTNPKQDLLTKLLHNRNLKTEEEIDQFLNPDLSRDMHDPFLMPDMKKAVNRIKKAIEKQERTMVFGDYDVDGITGSAILIHTLKKFGSHVSYRLPHRQTDGYGLREKFIREFANLGVKLIITVDNGISCEKEIALANANGIDVIITDHHSIPKKLPKAFAILHPRIQNPRSQKNVYPFEGLTGAGVAFKLAKALIFTLLPKEQHDIEILPLLDLACMGTIADLGPLRGENRAIVKFGLKILEQTRWPGLSRLKDFAGLRGKMDTRDIGFILGPRINAAGRISHPYFALQLLLDDGKRSQNLASHLETLNKKRQELMESLIKEALEAAETEISKGEKILVLSGKNWHSGIVGLMASKLVETFGRPAFVMEDRGEILVGSCRSVEGFSAVDAVKSAEKSLIAFGGHQAAAGFELKKENFEKFKENLKKHAEKKLSKEFLIPSLALECEIASRDLNLETAAMISQFEPFGLENETPRFLLKNVLPENISFAGKTKKHLKFTGRLENGNQQIDCIGFNLAKLAEKLVKSPLDIACELLADEWNGRKKLTLKILDFRKP